MEVTVEGEERHLRKGDTFFMPAGVEHSAKTITICRTLDVLFDPACYKVKTS
jgi:quercetin dioxygenase-like cupin family protein